MKRTTIFTAISLIFSLNAIAGETNQPLTKQPLNRDLVVAVTEPGVGASDTAWLLANQAISGQNVPVLLVLKQETRDDTLASLKLRATDLPALVFLDSNGNVLSRVIRAAPAEKLIVKTNEASVSLN
jgi:hypothetical protein